MPLEELQSAEDIVLVVDDEINLRKVLGALLRRVGFSVRTASNGKEALEVLKRQSVSVVAAALKKPIMDGLELLKQLSETRPDLPVIMITAYGTVDRAVESIKAGAFDFITKPFDRMEIKQVILKAAQQFRLNQQMVLPATEGDDTATNEAIIPKKYGMVGNSGSMNQIFQVIDRVADTPSTVLITGESGTGKELVARALHENSSRANQAFININCAAIPKELVESEFFGHERGAFTGAVNSKPGRFELANQGTLFLDEVAEIPIETQVKLLRVLQESRFERVGGVRTIEVNVRLIAATNQNLATLIKEGRFREDLFYRLNVVPAYLPPLRDRKEDIPALLRHAAIRASQRLGRPVPVFDDETIEVLKSYAWPGNIRELENIVERTVLLTDSKVLHVPDLPSDLLLSCGIGADGSPGVESDSIAVDTNVSNLKEAVRQAREQIERRMIARALDESGQNVTRAAQALEISRKSLQLKMVELGFRGPEKQD